MAKSALELFDSGSGSKSAMGLFDEQPSEKVTSAMSLFDEVEPVAPVAPTTEAPKIDDSFVEGVTLPEGVPLIALGARNLQRLSRQQIVKGGGDLGIISIGDSDQIKRDYSKLKAGIEVEFKEAVNEWGKIAGGPEYKSPIGTTVDSILRGAERIILQTPGFALGAFGAMAKGGEEIINQIALDNEINLKQLRDKLWEGYAEGVEALKPIADTMPATEGSDVVERIVFSPIEVAQTAAVEFAKDFEDYPNIQGAIELTGDAVGLYIFGRIVHGKSSKGEVIGETAKIANEAGKIAVAESEVAGIPDPIVRMTQQKIVEVKKAQLENRAKELAKKVSEEALIEEEIGRQVEGVERARVVRPVEGVEVKPEVPNYKKEFGTVKPSEAEIQKMTEEYADQVIEKKVKEKEVPKEEPIKEVDEEVGFENTELKGESSPFFQDKETTDTFMKIYDERKKAVSEDVELFTQKMINDANQWYHGNDGIEIGKLKNALSEMAGKADEFRQEFLTGVDHLEWKTTVEEAAKWVRELERANRKMRTVWDEWKSEIDATAAGEKPAFYYVAGDKNIIDYAKSKGLKVIKDVTDTGDFIAVKDSIEGKKISNELIKLSKERDRIFKTDNEELIDNWNYRFSKLLGYSEELANNIKGKYGYGPRDLELSRLNKYSTTRTKLYSGIPLDEAAKSLVAGAKKVAEYTKKARGLKAFKPVEAVKLTKESFTRGFVDRSGNIRKEFLKYGEYGYEALQKLVLSKGASSVSANMLKQMGKEVYSGLSRREKQILDTLILSDRMNDIASYKSGKNFKFPKGLEPESTAAYSNLFQYIEKLSPERAELIKQRAQTYYEWMKQPLKDMLETGLIDEAQYENLASHNYRRLKLVEIFDRSYQTKVGTKKKTVYDSGVEALSRGRDTDIFEPSSEIMALEVFNRAYGRILNNKANQILLEIARTDADNPFARVKEKGTDKIPSGWNRIFAYDKGERKSVYISPELSKEWINSSPELSYQMSQLLRWGSGSAVLRTFATGINWGFAVANLPRDVMHLWFSSSVYKDGKAQDVYSNAFPAYGLQIGSDLVRVANDTLTRKGRYEDYIKEGGGMEFLVHQGRLFQRGRHIDNALDPLMDFMGYFGETSELMTRLAIRERVIRKRAKEQGLTMEQARKNKKITEEASFAARDYMDFGQGGSITKALDNAIPYLNASIQGTRGLIRSFRDKPISSTFKLAQFASVVSGIYIAANAKSPKTMENLKGSYDAQNNLIIPLGDQFGFEDEEGQTRYPYIKIPIDPGQKFFKTFFEGATDKWLGNEVDAERIAGSLKEQSPVGVSSLPPTISGILGYFTNKDFWQNEDIWKKTEPFTYPNTKEEYIPGQTPQAYIDLGEETGLSPERTRYAVEELVTGGTVWSWLLNQGYETAFGDLPEEKKEQQLAETLSRSPITKRFLGITNPYSKYGEKIDKAEEAKTVDTWIQNRNFDALVDGYLYEGNVSRSEVIANASSYKDKDVYDRLIDRFKFEETIKNLPEKSFWRRMKGLDTETRAKIFVERLDNSDEAERQQLWKEFAIVSQAGGIVSESFREEVYKIRGSE